MVKSPSEVAKTYVGYKEIGINGNQFSKRLGRNAEAWCADFVVATAIEAGQSEAILNNPGVIAIHTWAVAKGIIVPKTQAKKDDLILFDWRHTGIPEHIGYVLASIDSHQMFLTIEGNCGNGNTSDGDGVYFKNRHISIVHSIIRPKWKATT